MKYLPTRTKKIKTTYNTAIIVYSSASQIDEVKGCTYIILKIDQHFYHETILSKKLRFISSKNSHTEITG